jgi:uncharacterized membrane protein
LRREEDMEEVACAILTNYHVNGRSGSEVDSKEALLPPGMYETISVIALASMSMQNDRKPLINSSEGLKQSRLDIFFE